MPGIFSKEFWLGSSPYRPKEYQPGSGYYAQQAVRGGMPQQGGLFGSLFGGSPAPGGPTQMGLAEMLLARAKGEAPSAAEISLRGGLAQAQRAASGAAAGMRSISPGLAARMAMQTQQGLSSAAMSQGAVLRAQEQAAAEQALGQHLYGMRGQDLQSEGQAINAWQAYQQMRMKAQPGSTGFLGNLLGTGASAFGAYLGASGGSGGASGGMSRYAGIDPTSIYG